MGFNVALGSQEDLEAKNPMGSFVPKLQNRNYFCSLVPEGNPGTQFPGNAAEVSVLAGR